MKMQLTQKQVNNFMHLLADAPMIQGFILALIPEAQIVEMKSGKVIELPKLCVMQFFDGVANAFRQEMLDEEEK
jgi:hypothetical protein